MKMKLNEVQILKEGSKSMHKAAIHAVVLLVNRLVCEILHKGSMAQSFDI
jgi:hypothetical protein